MENLPPYISIVFILTTILTVFFFYRIAGNSLAVILILLSWLALQGFIALNGFYTVTDGTPPRFILLILPPLLLIGGLFFSARGRSFMDRLDPAALTLFQICRVPVELVLFWLFVHRTVPRIMTFEGRNFDILSGLTAPVVYYFGFVKKRIGKKTLLLWNFIILGLLINIVVNAILSTPSPFQKFAFGQPNIAVLYFPYSWLPSCVVPLVLFSNLATIRYFTRR